jgi:hypothetical protein
MRVELVTVPAVVLEDAELREPLRDEEVVADDAGAGNRRGMCAVHFTSMVTLPPGATDCGNGTAITVSRPRCCRPAG